MLSIIQTCSRNVKNYIRRLRGFSQIIYNEINYIITHELNYPLHIISYSLTTKHYFLFLKMLSLGCRLKSRKSYNSKNGIVNPQITPIFTD